MRTFVFRRRVDPFIDSTIWKREEKKLRGDDFSSSTLKENWLRLLPLKCGSIISHSTHQNAAEAKNNNYMTHLRRRWRSTCSSSIFSIRLRGQWQRLSSHWFHKHLRFRILEITAFVHLNHLRTLARAYLFSQIGWRERERTKEKKVDQLAWCHVVDWIHQSSRNGGKRRVTLTICVDRTLVFTIEKKSRDHGEKRFSRSSRNFSSPRFASER